MKKPKLHSVKGVVEIWGCVLPCEIRLHDQGFTIYLDGDLHDGHDSLESFFEDCDGKIYYSLVAYKKDDATDLREWVELVGWTPPNETI